MLDITQKNLSPPITCFAAIRMQRLKDMRLLKSATDHANRVDQTSKLRVREGADRLNNLAFNPYCCPERLSVATFDYVADFKAMKRATKVVERGGTAPVAHFIAVVSPEWISQAGDVHDPKNPRNIQLFDVAIRWAKENFGDEALLSARMDLDENGAGVVDLFVAAAAHSKKGKKYLSISPRLKEIQYHYKVRNTYAGLQDSWAEWVQKELDPAIRRGKEKESRGPDRLSPENFGAKKDIEKERKKLEAERAALELERQSLDDEKQRIEISRSETEDQRRRLDEFSRHLDDRQAEIIETKVRQQATQVIIDKERSEIERSRAALISDRQTARQQGLEEGRQQAKAEADRQFELARQRGVNQGRSEADEERRIRAKNIQVVTKAIVADEILAVTINGAVVDLRPNLEEKKREEIVDAFGALPSTDRLVVGTLTDTKRSEEKRSLRFRQEVAEKAEKFYEKTRDQATKDGFLQAAQLIGKAYSEGLLALVENRITLRQVGEGPGRKFGIVPTEGQKPEDHQELMKQIAPALDHGLIQLLRHIALVLAQMKEAAASVKKQMSAILRNSPGGNGQGL